MTQSTEQNPGQNPEQNPGQNSRDDPGQSFAGAQLEDIETMSYEQAREELIAVVTKLETGGAPLEESLALWQRGEALADRCERWLDGASARLEEVRRSLEGAEPDQD